MKKQTKLTAVLSAAALLAIGASMTSFAAGWQQNDDSTWSYYDSDDNLVTGDWKKDGSKWFYLDDDGIMLTDSWVDDDHYVDEDGAMLVSVWKKTVPGADVGEPEDDGDDWYYFDRKGKKTVDESKKIGGKTYYFDTATGKMQDGWYETESGSVVYLGEEDDGSRKSGWLWLAKPEDDDEITGCDDACSICDAEGWYYFDSSGKMYAEPGMKSINGRRYFFSEHGQMLYEWLSYGTNRPGSNAQLDRNIGASSGELSVDDMIYTNVAEEGWRADGWYEIAGSEGADSDDSTDWYYFEDGKAKSAPLYKKDGNNAIIFSDSDGNAIYRAKIKINGKYFCFNEKGQMQTGLQVARQNEEPVISLYYFDENGYMKTGKVSNVEEDNGTFTYYFITSGSRKGAGYNGEKDGYLYWEGKRLEADEDYRIYIVGTKPYLVNSKGKIQKTEKEYDVENDYGLGGDNVTVKFDGNYVTECNGLNMIDPDHDPTAQGPETPDYDHNGLRWGVTYPYVDLYGITMKHP